MSYIIKNFKGKYNLSCPFDLNTKEFPRYENGLYQDHDIRIDCAHGDYIYHYGHSTLVAYFKSAQRCKHIAARLGYEPNLFSDCGEFKFNIKDIERVAFEMKAQTSHAKRSPFSVKNLPTTKEKNKLNRKYKIKDQHSYEELNKLIKCKVKAIREYETLYKEIFNKLNLEFKNDLKPLYQLDQAGKLIEAINYLKDEKH
jgi:hypothetical protein